MAAYTTIDDPSAYFQTVIWTGNGSARSITLDGNSDLQPDMVWLKQRSGSENHNLYDSVRGAGVRLIPNLANSQSTTNELTAFNSDGFSVTGGDEVNASSSTYVAWNWKAGTSFTNDASATGIGDIDSSGSVNTDAGFSIITATSDGAANKDIAHGLGAVPDVIFAKNLDTGYNWDCYFKTLGYNASLQLNATSAVRTGAWGSNTFTTTTFETGDDYSSKNGSPYIYYCFAEKQGYSKFGSYTGNGNANGPYIHLGFKPAFVIFKDTAARSWYLMDNKRDPENVVNNRLFPDAGDGDSTGLNVLDFLSNGIKIKTNDVSVNASGNTYTFISFAENPFVTSTGVPATAR